MPARSRNPLLSRIGYVAQNYNDYVTMATLAAWSEATGQHGLRQQMARIFYDQGENAKKALRFLPTVMGDWRAPVSTRYDRYLPWLAREFNKIYKPYKSAAKHHGAPAFPPGYDVGRGVVTHELSGQDPGLSIVIARLAGYTRSLEQVFRAVVDWAEATNADLSKVTWRQAEESSLEWAQQRRLEELRQGTVVYEWPDAWTVQELTTAEQLSDEGDVMQHCVGEGPAYFEAVEGGYTRIFSLRDPKGQPHATMEWNIENGSVEQFKGKQNVLPDLRYVLRMVPFRRDVLDRQSKVRSLSQFRPGVLDAFREELLGAWALQRPRITEGLHDEWFAVYEKGDETYSYPIYELDQAVDKVRDEALLYAEFEFESEDKEVEWIEDRLRDWASGTWVTGSTRSAELIQEADPPGLAWAVWQAHGYHPHDDPVDEMLEGILLMGVIKDDPRTPKGGREPIDVIKRRLTS